MIPFLPESWFPKKRNIDFHTPDRWWISPRIIHSESNQMNQPDFLYELFEDFMNDPINEDFSMDIISS